MSTSAGTLTIDFAAGIARLEADVKKAAKTVEKGAGQIDKAAGFAKKAVVGLAAAFGVHSFASFIKGAFDSGDALAKTADGLRATTQELAAFRHAGTLAGVPIEKVDKALYDMTRRVGEAALGTGEASAALKSMGLNARDLAQLSPEQMFGRISDSLNNVSNSGTRAALGNKIFSEQFRELSALVDEGSAGLAAARMETEALGTALTRVDAAKLEMANDAWDRLGAAVSGIGNRIAVGLAPYLKAIADWFTQSAIDANGWKDQINSALEKVAKAVAFVGDVFRGLQVVWKILEVSFQGLVAFIVNSWAMVDRVITAGINKIPGMSATVSQDLQDLAAATSGVLAQTISDLDTLANKPMPSTGIEAFFAKVKEANQKAAEEIAKSRAAGGSNSPLNPTFDDQGFADQAAKRFQSLSNALSTERQLHMADFQQKQMDLENYFLSSDQSAEEHREKQLSLETWHAKRITDIEKKEEEARLRIWESGLKAKMAITGGIMNSLSELMNTRSKKMFEVGKKAAIAETIMNTYKGAQAAFADTPGPIWVKALAGVAAVAVGLNRVNNIKSQQFGGGGVGGGGGAVGTFNANPGSGQPTGLPGVPQQSQNAGSTLTVIIEGNVIGNEQFVRDSLVPILQTQINDFDTVLIQPGSRQAAAIAGAA